MSNAFPTQSEAEREAVRQYRTGFMADNCKAVFRNGSNKYVVVGDRCFASGPVVSTVFKGKVYPE